uniref:Uncharacterized protein n=1 Tax=viral metagenome TaxID=1070528 RepID=A0A6H2A2A5_9ZZZZ
MSESQSYCLKGYTCINFAKPECPFKNEGKIFSECESFKPAIVMNKVDNKEVFAVAITRKEFLLLPMETRRRILERQAAAFLRGD